MSKAYKLNTDLASFDSLGVGVVIINTKSHAIEHVNKEMESMSLFERKDILNKNFLEVFSKKSRIRVKGLLDLEPIDNDIILSESNAVLRRKSGSALHVSLYVKPLQDSNQKLVTVINSEPRRELEVELEHLYAQMIQTSKFLSLAEMAAGIAHEINNPLAIVHSYAEQIKILASQNRLTGEKATELAEKMTHAAMRASKIINSLKKLSRNDPEDGLSAVPLAEILNEAIELCTERFAGYGVDLTCDQVEEDVKIYCNSSQILQVLLNLMENALHAVKAEQVRRVEVHVNVEDDRVTISVDDSGPGVPPDLQSDIMNPFFTTKEVGEGTGLGLSISRTIIEKHRGRFYYDSKKRGASFNFILPRVTGENSMTPPQRINLSLSSDKLMRASKGDSQLPFVAEDFKVLIVDDEVDLTEAVRFGLESKGYNVLTAHDGEEALEILNKESVDVVLTDIRMPRLGGFELLREMKTQLSFFPKVFFITGSSNIPMDEYFNEGAEGFFYKPVSIFKILETMKESLLPREKYFERERLRFYFDRSFNLSTSVGDQSISNIGRGGMFIEDEGDLPKVGDAIEFSLQVHQKQEKFEINGTAIVRWVRSVETSEAKRGFGVEFYQFEKEGSDKLFSFLDSLPTRAFIPIE